MTSPRPRKQRRPRVWTSVEDPRGRRAPGRSRARARRRLATSESMPTSGPSAGHLSPVSAPGEGRVKSRLNWLLRGFGRARGFPARGRLPEARDTDRCAARSSAEDPSRLLYPSDPSERRVPSCELRDRWARSAAIGGLVRQRARARRPLTSIATSRETAGLAASRAAAAPISRTLVNSRRSRPRSRLRFVAAEDREAGSAPALPLIRASGTVSSDPDTPCDDEVGPC